MDSDDYKTPGQLILDLLDAKGWSQRVLAVVLGTSESAVNKIISGRQAVDGQAAIALAEVFAVPAKRFIDLQASFDLARAELTAKPDPRRATRAHLFSGLPVADMIKRGWLGTVEIQDVKAVEASLARFFGVPSVDEIEVLPHAAKKTDVFGGATPEQIAWLRRARQIAAEMMIGPYSETAARRLVSELQELRISPEACRKAPRLLEAAGIRLVIVESLPRAKVDGACFWLNDSSPVIGMTMRFDRVDNFWFVLRHELEHVLRGHGKTTVMLDADIESSASNGSIADEELAANSAASEFCVPQKKLDEFIARKDPFFSKRDILAFARIVKVHPGLVAGQIQRRTGRYELFREHQVKVRTIVSPGASVDGWGDVYPVGM
jgi:HTH-type transcriptional regulator/antitoxin HigA